MIGLFWKELEHFPILLLLLCSLTFFFANHGPNATTFILPSLVFLAKCRSTLNGLSVAAGKLGALVGATLFAPMAKDFGNANAMLVCAGIAVVAFCMTQVFARAQKPPSHGPQLAQRQDNPTPQNSII